MTALRRLRATAIIGVTWAIAWSAIGVLLFPIFSLLPAGFFVPALRWQALGIVAGYGCFAGTLFAALVKASGKRRTADVLTRREAAQWGLGVAFILLAPPVAFLGVIGFDVVT